MKNFSSKRRGNFRRSFSVTAIIALVCVGLAIVLLLLLRGVFGTAGSYVMTPLYRAAGWVTGDTSSIGSFFRSRADMEEEIRSLRDSVLAESGNAYTIERLLFENTELRQLLGDDAKAEQLVAGVVARPPLVPYDALLIDRGAVDGVLEGAVVYYTADRAIGTVAKAYDTSSVVNLFSTPLSKITVYIVGPNIYTTAHGAGGGVIRVSVPQGILLTEGDLVLLPGLEGGVLGKISAIESEPTNPEQNAYIVQEVPLQSLHLVGVGKVVPPTLTFEEARANIENQKQTFLLDVPAGVLVDVGTSTATTSAATTTTAQ